jgi:CheY-like chemotaxis protein
MSKVLLIDDDPHLRKILSRVLSKYNYEVVIAEDGMTGLRAARNERPDLIILDIIMPGMDGFEVAQRLHSDPICARIPIMVLTAYATPYGRKTAVEVGVDDFVTKPFGLDEIVAKVKAMTTTPFVSPNETTAPLKTQDLARIICFHTLRGGLGSTSLALNMAVALNNLWQWPTLLMDASFANGQVALALNWPESFTWTDLMQASLENTTHRLLENKLAPGEHVQALTASPDPRDARRISPRFVSHSLRLLEQPYEYIVADLAHDLGESTLELLRNADKILHLVSADRVSLQLAKHALETYAIRGIQPDDVLLVMVDTRPGRPAKVRNVEMALGQSLAAYIPFTPEMTEAANRSLALVDVFPDHLLTQLIEDLAFLLSKPSHRDVAQSMPTPVYKRVHARAAAVARNGAMKDLGRYFLKQAGVER